MIEESQSAQSWERGHRRWGPASSSRDRRFEDQISREIQQGVNGNRDDESDGDEKQNAHEPSGRPTQTESAAEPEDRRRERRPDPGFEVRQQDRAGRAT